MATNPLIHRHNRVTRLTHWANALGLMVLLMSGLMIFNAHPHLYWGHASETEKIILSISSDDNGIDPRGYVELIGRRLDTTGFLGVQMTADGPRQGAFPAWLTIPSYYSLASARRWHFFFGWFFAINSLLYIAYNLAVGHMRKFPFTPHDAAKVPAMIAYEMNDHPLPVAHGAPLRLRVENRLGYKQAKYVRALEFVASFEKIADGKGGYWPDQGYERYAGI